MDHDTSAAPYIDGVVWVVQMYELRNIGPQALDYIVDMSPIEHLKTTNYGFKVLECMNPQGVVPPFGVAHIKWRFQPMEMMIYQVSE
jgi:hypothetical protein